MEGNRENTLGETLKNDLSEDTSMFEMANLLPCRTGLTYQVWYSAKSFGYQPRLKVDISIGTSIYIQIENHEVEGDIDKIASKEVQRIFDWIDLNREALLKYWNEAPFGKIDTVEMNNLLKPIQ